MVVKCCVPGCRTNLSYPKDRKFVSCFRLPKDEKLRMLWLKSIARPNFNPSPYSAVCINHFEESDVIKQEKYLRPDGIIQMLLLKNVRLKQNAIPKIFPNLPEYISKPTPKARTDPQLRKNDNISRQENEIETFSDIIVDFDDLINNYSVKIDVSGWGIKKVYNRIYFYVLNFEKSLTVDVSLQIDRNLQSKLYIKNVQISPNDLKWILPFDLTLSRWSQLTHLLVHYKNVRKFNEETFHVSTIPDISPGTSEKKCFSPIPESSTVKGSSTVEESSSEEEYSYTVAVEESPPEEEYSYSVAVEESPPEEEYSYTVAVEESSTVKESSIREESSIKEKSSTVEESSTVKESFTEEEEESPCLKNLKRKISSLEKLNTLNNARIRTLQKTNWRQKQQISSLKAKILELHNRNLLLDE